MLSATSWPGIVGLIFTWYTPKELAFRLAIFNVSDVAGAMFLGVVQAELYVNMNGVNGLAGWQWLFIVSGAITVLLGLIGLLIVPDSPSNTRALWLTRDDRELAKERMHRFGIETARLIPWKTLLAKLGALIIHPLTYLFVGVFVQQAWSHRANAYFLLYLKGVTDEQGAKLYTTYQVNIIPLGGYALQILSSVVLNTISDWKGWRWQIFIGCGIAHVIGTSILASWPNRHGVVMFAYYLTYATNAAGPSLLAWLAELLRMEPEARTIIVGLSVTVVYVGHATIPLGAWKVTDSPRYPIGFPLATAFQASAMLGVLAIRFWFMPRNPNLMQNGYGKGKKHMDEEKSEEGENGTMTKVAPL